MYHVPLVRNQLTRNIGALFPEIRDEIVAAFSDIIPVADGRRRYSLSVLNNEFLSL